MGGRQPVNYLDPEEAAANADAARLNENGPA